MRAHEVYNGYTRILNARTPQYKKSDWSIIADVNIRLYKNLNLNLRYEYSLVPVRVTEFQYILNAPNTPPVSETHKYHNNMLSARLIYYINEKFYKNTRVNKYGQVMGTTWLREIPDYDE